MEAKEVQILLVDDERDILEILRYNLSKEGYQITTAGNGKEALRKAKNHPPHLIILDLMMPVMDGIETCKRMRENQELQDTIIIFLTARGEDESEMAGYHAGADDYITKPIRPKVLISKVKALLRRLNTPSHKSMISVGDLVIDRDEYVVTYGNKNLKLPRKEFELLALLAAEPNKVFRRDKILETIWGKEVVVGDRTIDVHIRKLREKIGADKFETVKGVGYKYKA